MNWTQNLPPKLRRSAASAATKIKPKPKDSMKVAHWFVLGGALIALTILTIARAYSQEGLDDKCKGYIATECSCTHNACWETKRGEVTQLDINRFIHNPTGFIFERKGWAKDGKETICAFNPTLWSTDKKYVGPGNPVSCYYPVPDKNMF